MSTPKLVRVIMVLMVLPHHVPCQTGKEDNHADRPKAGQHRQAKKNFFHRGNLPRLTVGRQPCLFGFYGAAVCSAYPRAISWISPASGQISRYYVNSSEIMLPALQFAGIRWR